MNRSLLSARFAVISPATEQVTSRLYRFTHVYKQLSHKTVSKLPLHSARSAVTSLPLQQHSIAIHMYVRTTGARLLDKSETTKKQICNLSIARPMLEDIASTLCRRCITYRTLSGDDQSNFNVTVPVKRDLMY